MGRSAEERRLKLKLPDHVKGYISNGKPYFYFRGTNVQLPGLPWSPEFMAVHAKMMAAMNASGGTALARTASLIKRGVDPDTVQPLIGVYLLMLRGRVVYIGSSLNMPNRVADHRSNGRPFDEVFYIATRANRREALEATLIRAINPSQNRKHRSDIIGANGNSITEWELNQ